MNKDIQIKIKAKIDQLNIRIDDLVQELDADGIISEHKADDTLACSLACFHHNNVMRKIDTLKNVIAKLENLL